MIAALALGATLFAWLGVGWLARPGNRWSAAAEVNHRSLHRKVTPQGGGLAVMAALVVGWAVAWFVADLQLFGGSVTVGAVVLVAVLSYVDDRRPIPSRVRLLVHVSAAALIVVLGGSLLELEFPYLTPWRPSSGLAWAVSIPALVWFTNLYNFMDGMDGLAGGMTVIGFGALGALGLLASDPEFAASGFLVAGAALGFLGWNFPPARIFLGDVGAAPLGLLAGAMTLWGVDREVFSIAAPLLIFAPFWVDATVTLLRRLLRGERVWEAHRTHLYQRLASSGWGHRRTTLWEYAAMGACAAAAFAYEALPDVGAMLLLAVVGLGLWGAFRFAAARPAA